MPKRTWLRRLLYALAALVLLIGAVAIYDALRAKVYFISVLSFTQFQDSGVPDDVLVKLNEIRGKRFESKTALQQEMEQRVGVGSYARYRSALNNSIRSRACWKNTSTQPIHQPGDSTTHPLHNAFALEPVLPLDALPFLVTVFAWQPDGQGMVAVGKKGTLIWYDANLQPRMRVDLPDVYQGDGDQGALGLALGPDYATNHHIFVGHVTESAKNTTVVRVTLSDDPQAVLASRVEIFRAPKDNEHDYHGIGQLLFRSDGLLLIPLGDPVSHSQALWDVQGKLMGIRPKAEGGYDGPGLSWWQSLRSWALYGDAAVLANGLRSPWSATLWGDDVLLGDVGGNGAFSTEEVNWYRADTFVNWGWGACEDPYLHADFTPPLIVYYRNDPEPGADAGANPEITGRSVLVGPVYQPQGADPYDGALTGRLLYTDFYLSFLRGAKLEADGTVSDDVNLLTQPFLTHLNIGPDGYVYATCLRCEAGLLKLVRKP